MRILRKDLRTDGGYYNIENSWTGIIPPETHYEVAEGVELSCGGFGTLIFTDDVVTGFVGDETAYTQWVEEHPESTPEKPLEEKLNDLVLENTALKEQLTAQDSAITAILEEIIPSLFLAE